MEEKIEFIPENENIASDLIHKNSVEYIKYIFRNHFPNAIDGLKFVHRRIIWSIKDEQKKIKGTTLTGKTNSLHPYGNNAIYESALKMSQDFSNVFPLIKLSGTSSSYSGDTAAADRYAEFILTDFCRDVFLKGIEFQTLTFELAEDLMNFEPSYFIPRFPYKLISFSETIGFGFKSLSFSYPIEIICDMIVSYANHVKAHRSEMLKKWDYSEFLKDFIPVFPIKNSIRNSVELIEEYEKGNFEYPVLIDGDIQFVDQSSIMIKNIAFRNSITSILPTLTNIIRDKNNQFGKNIEGLKSLAGIDSGKEADIFIKFKKSANIFEMIERVKTIIKFTSKLAPFNNFPDGNIMLNKSPIDILKSWFSERYRSILGKKKYQQQRLINRKRQIEALLLIGKHTNEIIKIIRNETEESCLKILMKNYKLSYYQSKYIRGSKISAISKIDIEKTKEEYESIKIEIDLLLKSFNTIEDEIIRDIEYFRNKYATPEDVSYVPKYIGYIKIINQGILLFENFVEMSKLLHIFKNQEKKIVVFPKKIQNIFIVGNNENILEWNRKIVPEKISSNIDILINVPNNVKNTIVLKNGNIFRVKDFQYTKEHTQVYFTNKNSIKVLNRDGKISDINVEDVPLRNNINSQGNRSSVLWILGDSDSKNFENKLFLHNSMNNTKISVYTITESTKKIKLLINGNITIFGLFPINDKHIFLNLPNGSVCEIDGSKIDKEIKEFPISKYKI